MTAKTDPALVSRMLDVVESQIKLMQALDITEEQARRLERLGAQLTGMRPRGAASDGAGVLWGAFRSELVHLYPGEGASKPHDFPRRAPLAFEDRVRDHGGRYVIEKVRLFSEACRANPGLRKWWRTGMFTERAWQALCDQAREHAARVANNPTTAGVQSDLERAILGRDG